MADQTYAALEEEVSEAEKELVAVAREEPVRWWDPYELRKKARNGWSPGAMGIALDNLVDRKVFVVNSALRVRYRG